MSFDPVESQVAPPTQQVSDWPMSLDEPAAGQAFVPGVLTVRGWYLDPPEPVSITAHVAGLPLVRVDYGKPRDDVARAFPKEANARQSGFAGCIDMSSLAPGEHEVTLSIKRASGAITELRRKIRVLSPCEIARGAENDFSDDSLRLHLDEPVENTTLRLDSILSVRGWALARSGVEGIEVWLNGNGPHQATTGILREDVGSQFGKFPEASRAGFLWTTLLSGIDPGIQTLRIRLLSKTGRSAEIVAPLKVDSKSDYELWYNAHAPTKAEALALYKSFQEFEYQPQISIITPVFRTPEAFLRKCVASVKSQTYPHWELVLVDDGSGDAELTSVLHSLAEGDRRIKIHTLPSNLGIAMATNAGFERSHGDYVAFLDHDDEISVDALYRVVEALNEDPSIDVLYSDEDRIDEQGRHRQGFFKPDWSPDLLLSLNYVCHFLVVRRTSMIAVGGLRPGFDGSQDYDLIVRLCEHTQKIRHLAKILYHWRIHQGSTTTGADKKPAASDAGRRALEEHLSRRGLSGAVQEISPCRYRVKYEIAGKPEVSIIIPTGGSKTLTTALDSIFETSTYPNYSIVIVDNSSGETVKQTIRKYETQRERLKLLDCRNSPFNFSRLCNRGAQVADSRFLLFLNDDTTVITPDWIQAMLEHAQRPEIGAVGAQLLFPNNTLQHTGIVMGLFGVAGHPFRGLPNIPHYFGLSHLIRNCTAVTGACLMIRREAFEQVDGFEEFELPTCFQDVDLCLKLIERGHRVVYTPFAQLYHHESYSKKALFNPGEIAYIQTRWRNFIADDPYYNPNLTRRLDDYSLDDDDDHMVRVVNSGVSRAARSLLSEKSPYVDHTVAASQRIDALRSNTEARIFALRTELERARRRSEELRSEVVLKSTVVTDLRFEKDKLIEQKENLSATLEGVLRSLSWRVTEPVRRISERVPAIRTVFRRTSRIASQPSETPQTVSVSAAPIVLPTEQLSSAPMSPANVQLAPESALVPSRRFRLANPAWVEPHKRAEFLQLRNLAPRARIAVVLHLYYPDLWQEILDALLGIVEPFDLFVTLVRGFSEHVAPEIRAAFSNANILTVDNHGRDILPFLELLRTGALFKYELACKLHSKRSISWRQDGDEWRQRLVRGVLGSPERIQKIIRAFDSDPDLGMLVADGQLFNGLECWISNEARLRQLLPKIGLNSSSFEKSFAGGSVFWIRPFLLRSINALDLGFDDFEPEPIESDGTTAHAVERLFSLVCHDAGMRIGQVGKVGSSLPSSTANLPRVHVIANYLPQFYPIPENNASWGQGFTEWTNVTSATPLFPNHRQPRLPADLGFYDLRLTAVRQDQADLARQYGIAAFSYYYFWFNGKRLLERPLDEMLASGTPDFPFMICWANEPWTRNWDGLPQEILVPQDYKPGWEQAFAADVAPFLRDRRYFRLNGRPVLAIYRVMHVPEAAAAMLRLRTALAEQGFPDVHLIGGWLRLSGAEKLPAFPEELNLDAYFEFPPHDMPVQDLKIDQAELASGFAGRVCDYNATVDAVIDQLAVGSEGFRYRGVMTGWDNTPRRGRNGLIFHGATPTNFRRWVRAAVERARAEALQPETAIFINAWNEWGEGTYLEPDRDFGHGWLEAVASVANPAACRQIPEPSPSGNMGNVRVRA